MTKERRIEAIKIIEAQLEGRYVDFGMNDNDELEIIKEAIQLLKIANQEYIIPIEDWKKLGYTDEEAKELAEASNIYA